MPRLFWRLFFAIWLTVVAFVAIMAAISDHLTRQATGLQDPMRLQSRLEAPVRRLQRTLAEDGPEAATVVLKRLPAVARSLIYVVYDDDKLELLGRHKKAYRLLRHQRGERGLIKTQVQTPAGKRYTILALPRLPVRAILQPTPLGTGIRLLVAALISALVSFLLARSLSAPLEQLRHSSKRLAEGDLGARAGVLGERKDEFGRLARDFDRMAGQLQALDRSRRRLLRDVSHELRSPLARLQVALELARSKAPGTVDTELERIGLESQRLEHLIAEVLTLLKQSSATQPLERQKVNLTRLLREVIEHANFEANGSAAAGVDYQSGKVVELSADHELIYRALENIIRNGMKYTDPEKGLAVRLEPGADNVIIRVRDFGPGVPPQSLSHLFEPFYRVGEARDRDSGGYGLGLAIAAAAVERHGGQIKAENAAGGGLTVVVTLPLGNSDRG